MIGTLNRCSMRSLRAFMSATDSTDGAAALQSRRARQSPDLLQGFAGTRLGVDCAWPI